MGKMSLQTYFVVIRDDVGLGLKKGEVLPAVVHQFEGDKIVRIMFVRKVQKKGWFRTRTVTERRDEHMDLSVFVKLFKPIKGAKFDPEMIRVLYE